MVQFYNRPDPGAAFGQGLSEGFLDTFGEGLQFKRNKSRFDSAIGKFETELGEGDLDSPAKLMMSLVKHVGHLPGGAQIISNAAPSLFNLIENKGMGEFTGKVADAGRSKSLDESITDAVDAPSSKQTQPQQAQPSPTTQDGTVVSQPPSGRGVQQKAVEIGPQGAAEKGTPPSRQAPSEFMSKLQGDLGVTPNLTKYAPLTPGTPPALRPPLTPEQRATLIKESDPKLSVKEKTESLNAYDKSVSDYNQLQRDNYIQNENYKSVVQKTSDNLYNLAKEEIKPADESEEGVLNTISQQQYLNTENPRDALPAIRQEFNRFKKIRSDVQKESSIGGSEIVKSIISGVPVSEEVKRKTTILESLSDTYKKYGIEDNFRADMSKDGWPPVTIDTTLNPLTPEQKEVIGSIQKSQVPTMEKRKTSGPYARSRSTLAGARDTIPVEKPNVIAAQVEEIKPQLAQVMNNPSMKDQSLNVLRQAFIDKGYEWRAISNAMAELSADGEVNLGSYQQANLNDITRPPLEGLDSLWENGVFNTLKGWFFNVK